MKKVPKKNIDHVIRDLRGETIAPQAIKSSPNTSSSKIDVRAVETLMRAPHEHNEPSVTDIIPRRRIPLTTFFAGIFVAMVVTVFGLYRVSMRYVNLAFLNAEQFRAASDDLKGLRPKDAEQKLLAAQNIMNDPFIVWSGKVLPFFKDGGQAFQNFQNIMNDGLALSQEAVFLGQQLPDLLMNKKGTELIASLEKMHNAISKINSESKEFAFAVSAIEDIAKRDHGTSFPLQPDLARYEKFSGALLNFLKTPGSRHILVLFQNPSEIRPAGGFLGSYADITIEGGAVEEFHIRNINDADRGFNEKIIPPRPLQLTMRDWKIADANWFFDFPTTANKVSELMEASNLYRDASTKFDGVIAISPKILTDILSATGPIDLKGASTTIDEKNFLNEIQRQVQIAQAAKKTNPKSILEEAAPLLLERLALLSSDNQAQLVDRMKTWISHREVIFSFKDSNLMSFFDDIGGTGRVYPLEKDFYGDYLAVIDANVSGGKSDIFIKQKVVLQSQLTMDGTLNNHLVISREHRGNEGKYWWYKVLNQDYLQIMTAPESRLINTSGGSKKTIYPKINYAKNGYTTDDIIATLENSSVDSAEYPTIKTSQAFGKSVFSTWSELVVGEKDTITLDYARRLPLTPSTGQTYHFVFEKQPGTERDYQFEISAPVGYHWRENKLPIFELKTGDPAGRTIIDLTLEKTN